MREDAIAMAKSSIVPVIVVVMSSEMTAVSAAETVSQSVNVTVKDMKPIVLVSVEVILLETSAESAEVRVSLMTNATVTETL